MTTRQRFFYMYGRSGQHIIAISVAGSNVWRAGLVYSPYSCARPLTAVHTCFSLLLARMGAYTFFIYKGHPKIPSTHWPLFWPNFPVLMALKWPLFFFARTLIPLSSGKIREQNFLLNQTLIFSSTAWPLHLRS